MNDESPSVVHTTDGLTIVFRGRNLYHPATPRRSACARTQSVKVPNYTLVIVASPLIGHGLLPLLERCDGTCRFVLLELEPKLAEITRRILPREIFDDPRVTIVTPDTPDQLEHQFSRELFSHCRRAMLVRPSGGYALHARHYDRVLEWSQDEIRRAWQNRLTTMHMGRLWFRNLFDNLPLLPASQPLHTVALNRPVVVVGAGPSLERLLPSLSEQRTSLFLLAVDTAVPVLGSANIRPDAVVAVEAQHANLSDFIGADLSQTHLITDLFSLPSVARQTVSNRRSFFTSLAVESRLLDRLRIAGILPPELPPLGSVGVVAVALAAQLTASPIALAGLDFAYPDGKSHARGAPWMIRELVRTYRLRRGEIYGACLARPRISVPGKTGAPCKSDIVLLSYAEQVRALCAQRPGVFDVSPEGLPTGAQLVSGIKEYLGQVAHAERSANQSHTGPRSAGIDLTPAPSAQTIALFLKRERALVSATREAALAAAAHLTATTQNAFEQAVSETDYVACGLPITPDAPEAARPIAASAGFFLVRIDRAIARLEEANPRRS
ncbi:MAG: DUF115 domain-containing protein [Spirochaetaceae bacterium]|nr:MAG: DUF115 domain-containing protein [Spirochaetaceae bacterium]